MGEVRRAAVIGAGIGGLTAALALARRGCEVVLFERAPELGEVGAGLQLGPNGMKVMAALGIADAVRAAGVVPEMVELRDHDAGRPLMRLPMGAAADARWGAPMVNLHRADLVEVLAAAVKEAGVELRLGREITAGGTVQGEVEGKAFDIVVGADGIRSTLRAEIGQGSLPRYTGHVAWRALVTRDPAEPAVTALTLGPDRHLVTYALRGGTLANVVAVARRADWRGEGWFEEDDPDTLRATFAGWNDAAEALLARVEQTWLWGLFDHAPLPRWHLGRLVLLGDACHPMLPFLAQGATQAVEDAWVLADAVGAEGLNGLETYAARRIDRATRVQRAAVAQGRLDHLGGLVRPVVQLGMRTVGAVTPGFAARRFDWLYGHDVTAG
ncbi:FAD-dependent oxidoreductase [Pontivivens ytuae]|uniref:FAD-dependent monooxygenase n=1 Tax=Pontivivens ytuae TaxID=2789856 RepID=A0A7S9LQ24_9RHOB|nr:FAD-dependent oxidoreductase [Pontivivens ytuae]QPH53142.1 FAD-dependent monooxygenase [Pontivivens ytuae]